MDPDKALEEVRHLVHRFLHDPAPSNDGGATEGEAVELAEKIDGLDKWLKSGGYPPMEWQRGSKR